MPEECKKLVTAKSEPTKFIRKQLKTETLKNKENGNFLFLRYLHCKPPAREIVRKLHPSIIDVRYPRQKSAKFCHLEFESKNAALKALEDIKKFDSHKEVLVQPFTIRLPKALSQIASIQSSVKDSGNMYPEKKPIAKTFEIISVQKRRLQKRGLDEKVVEEKGRKLRKVEDKDTEVKETKEKEIKAKEIEKKMHGKKISSKTTPQKKTPVKTLPAKEVPVNETPKKKATLKAQPKQQASSSSSKIVTKQTKVKKDTVTPRPCLRVSGLPDMAVKEVLQNLYPSNNKTEIGFEKNKKKRYALVHFESIEEATRALETSKDVSVNGDTLTVKFHE